MTPKIAIRITAPLNCQIKSVLREGPSSPLEFPWVSCVANMLCGAAYMVRGAADTSRGAADMSRGAADTSRSAADTATSTAFTSF